MSHENLVRDVLESAENVLATAIKNALGMIQTVAPEQAIGITRAMVDDQIAFVAHSKKRTLQ